MTDENKKNLEWWAYVCLAVALFVMTIAVCVGVWTYCPFAAMKVAAVFQLALDGYIIYRIVKKIFSIK